VQPPSQASHDRPPRGTGLAERTEPPASGRPLVNKRTSGRGVSGLTKPSAYIAACVNSEHDAAPWFLWLWNKDGTGAPTRVPHQCGSWRCPGKCARHRAAKDFVRIRDALGAHNPDHVCFLVLTLDRNGTYTGLPWVDRWQAYRALSEMSRKLMKRLNRHYEFDGAVGSRWVATVEAHRSGWPHLNIVCVSAGLSRDLRATTAARARAGKTDRETKLVDGVLLAHVLGSGFGPQSTAEVAGSGAALAGYIVKLAGELEHEHAQVDASVPGEIAKLTQTPDNAPHGFRRLRSGKGFLPAKLKNEKVTGALFGTQKTAGGTAVFSVGRKPSLSGDFNDYVARHRKHNERARVSAPYLEAQWLILNPHGSDAFERCSYLWRIYPEIAREAGLPGEGFAGRGPHPANGPPPRSGQPIPP